MRRWIANTVLGCGLLACSDHDDAPTALTAHSLIPLPVTIVPEPGEFVLEASGARPEGDWTVQQWLDPERAHLAAAAGAKVILSPFEHA